jgi:hypothetical protein
VRGLAIILGAFALSACATAKLHDQQALNTIALGCGMTYGELLQDEQEKRLLIALKNDISASQQRCIVQWARKNHLKPVFVHIEMPDS